MQAPGLLYIQERLAGGFADTNYRVGQSYRQDFLEQQHRQTPKQITILIIFTAPNQVKCRSPKRLTQATAQRYIAANLHIGPLGDRDLNNGTAGWWDYGGLEVVELMRYDPLLHHLRFKVPEELYVFVQLDYWVAGVVLPEFVFRGRFYPTTIAAMQAQASTAAMQAQVFIAVIQAQVSIAATQAQVSTSATQAQVSTPVIDGVNNAGSEVDADDVTVVEEPPIDGGELCESKGELVVKSDSGLDDMVISDNEEDSEDLSTYLSESDTEVYSVDDRWLIHLSNDTDASVTDRDMVERVLQAQAYSIFR